MRSGHYISHALVCAVVTFFATIEFAVQLVGQKPAVAKTLVQSTPFDVLSTSQSEGEPADIGRRMHLSVSYGKLPISFEVNQGQADGSVQFLAHGAGYNLFLTRGEAVLSLHATQMSPAGPNCFGAQNAHTLSPRSDRVESTLPSSSVRIQLIGSAMTAQPIGVDPLPGKSNYFIGSDPAKWHTDVPTYAKVRYENVYPGVDLVYYGNQDGQLEHDFVLAPGANPDAIAIGLIGSEGIVQNRDGGLSLRTGTRELTLRSPVVYQTIDGQRETIPATYALAGNQVRFHLGSYDRDAPLIIDPVLQYSGVFGSATGDDVAKGIAVDGSGNVYIAGWTNAVTDFPLVNPFQTSGHELISFVSKVNAAGTALLYSTYLGSEVNVSAALGIAVDAAGRAYVVGYTEPGFPVKNAYQPLPGGGSDAFLTVFGPNGNTLVYSTYLGGADMQYYDYGFAVAVDASGNAYITGNSGHGFPTLHSVQQDGMVFVAKFNRAGALQYSSVFGAFSSLAQTQQTVPYAIAVDSSGAAYIAGTTQMSNFPIRKPAFQETCPACPKSSAFVTKISPAGSSLIYSTYLGSKQGNSGYAIAVDGSGSAYIAGITASGFPVKSNALQKYFGGGKQDGFVAKLNASGTSLLGSTYVGGSGNDAIYGLALDQYRQVYVTGYTNSPNFPLQASLQSNDNSTGQIFVTTLMSTLSSIAYYSTLFGTHLNFPSIDYPVRIAVDKALNVYLAGEPLAIVGSFPTTPGAVHIPAATNLKSIFVSKFVIMDDLALGISASSGSVLQGNNLTYTIAVTSKGPDFAYNLRVDDPVPAGTTFVSYGAGGGTCTAPEVGGTGNLHCVLPQLRKGDTYAVTLTVNVTAVSGATLSNTATTVSNMQDFVQDNNKGTLTTKVN